MFGFSGKLLITNIFNHINNNLFSVILGKYYSKIEVGYYNQSNKWCGMGQQFILGMINGVAQPVLAKISEDTDRQQRVFRKMLRFTAFISFPAMLGLGIIAEELIVISITDKWYSSVSIMQILCISGAFVPIANLTSNLHQQRKVTHLYVEHHNPRHDPAHRRSSGTFLRNICHACHVCLDQYTMATEVASLRAA